MPVNSGASWLVRLKLDVKSDLEDARPEVIQTADLSRGYQRERPEKRKGFSVSLEKHTAGA